jgi:hypothetical protein
LPDGGQIVSSPLATTLIYGEREAAVVDPHSPPTRWRGSPTGLRVSAYG